MSLDWRWDPFTSGGGKVGDPKRRRVEQEATWLAICQTNRAIENTLQVSLMSISTLYWPYIANTLHM